MTNPFITVDMSNNAHPGSIQLIARVSGNDRNKINTAAGRIGMTQAQFLRSALVGAAEAILHENEESVSAA